MAHSKHILTIESDSVEVQGLIPAMFLIGANPKKLKYWFSHQADLDAALEAVKSLDVKTTVDGPATEPAPAKAKKKAKKKPKAKPTTEESDDGDKL